MITTGGSPYLVRFNFYFVTVFVFLCDQWLMYVLNAVLSFSSCVQHCKMSMVI